MLMFLKTLEFRQMFRHLGIRKSFTISAVISHAEGNEVIFHNTTDITLVVQVVQCLIVKKFVFLCFAWYISCIVSLSAAK